ncbi:protein RETICULATA-RELATED 1, chloroplastic-like [Gossypium australe]|uniref:Protein RETICULATA-RELATED 1, chloroplastic-like n=1 Tax=Gossypium australe TaxID=47621 RepID=A0A5B6WV48_9ROSI|nr:protein RETICULATA-RELATED 1, chloroplastic-like [Gossypium australe]
MSISSPPPRFKLSALSNGGGNGSMTINVIGTRNFARFKGIIEIESRLKLTSSRFKLSCFSTLHCVRPPDSAGNTAENGEIGSESSVSDIGISDQEKIGGGCGGGGRDNGGNDSFGGGGGEDEEGKEFGPILKFEEVKKEAEARGVKLPSDMMNAAKSCGIRKLFLLRYLDLQVGIDSFCATFAKMKKRGDAFWSEFELYLADVLVGLVIDVALVGMLAPYARFSQPSAASRGLFGSLQQACSALPSSVFEAERPGCTFSAKQRIATFFYKGVLYGSVGFGCGLVGQGIANLVMTTKRRIRKSDEDNIPVPPLLRTASLWGVFLAVSANARYQIINGLEQLVEASPVTKQVPPVAMAFTIGVRFANNVYSGMQFVDWAKWSGVQ